MRSELKHFLDDWAKRSGVADVASDISGAYYLLFDAQYEVRLSDEMRSIRMEADLGELPEDRRAATAILDELMALHLAGGQDASEVLAIDAETGRLILFNSLKTERLDPKLFARALSQFVNGLEFWARQLKALRTPSSSPIASPAIVRV